MFHSLNNLFFERLINGDVRIFRKAIKERTIIQNNPVCSTCKKADICLRNHRNRHGDDHLCACFTGFEEITSDYFDIEQIIPADSWVSAVASVSKKGEDAERFYIFQKLHNEDIIGVPPAGAGTVGK